MEIKKYRSSNREHWETALSNKIPLYIKRKKRNDIVKRIVIISLIVDFIFMVFYGVLLLLDFVLYTALTNAIFISSLLLASLLLLKLIVFDQ